MNYDKWSKIHFPAFIMISIVFAVAAVQICPRETIKPAIGAYDTRRIMQVNPTEKVPRIFGSGIRRAYSIEQFENPEKEPKGWRYYYIKNKFDSEEHDALFRWMSFKYDLQYGVEMSIECSLDTREGKPEKKTWSDITHELDFIYGNDGRTRAIIIGNGQISDTPPDGDREGRLSGCNYVRIKIVSEEDNLFWRITVKKWAVYVGGNQ